MSEKPFSLIDDKKSSQVTYNTDQIINNESARGAFFEHAENGNLYSPTPPEFDLYEEPTVFDSEMMNEAQESSAVTEAPAYAQEHVSHREMLERAYHYMDTVALVDDARSCTKALIITRQLY